jgi:hypothetical protein
LSVAGATEALRRPVYSGGSAKPFGDLTRAEVAARAEELAAGAGLGHASRVAAVAAAWRELARTMESAGAERVRDLDADTVPALAERLWVMPPGGSLLP